jgi:hypothetical protein
MVLLLIFSITHNFTLSKLEYRVAGEVAEKTGQCLQSQAGRTFSVGLRVRRANCDGRAVNFPYLQG